MKELIKKALGGNFIQMAKDKVRFALTFDPTDPDKMSQQPPARDGYRYPAPGSITGARIPDRVEDKDGIVSFIIFTVLSIIHNFYYNFLLLNSGIPAVYNGLLIN